MTLAWLQQRPMQWLVSLKLAHSAPHTHKHTQQRSAVDLQLNTVLWLNAAIQFNFTAVNAPKWSLSVIAKNTLDKSPLIDVKCEAELAK